MKREERERERGEERGNWRRKREGGESLSFQYRIEITEEAKEREVES